MTLVELSRSQALTRALAPIIDELLTPALIVDLDAVEHNLAATIERVGGVSRWRPHIKTSKQAVVVELMLRAGLRHFKVATVDELALVLHTAAERAVADVDVLFAYPATTPTLHAIASLARESAAQVSVLADSPAHLELLDELSGKAAWPELSVMLDVDLGMHRTGTAPERWSSLSSEHRVVGLHGYDGHLRWDQRAEAHAGYDRLCELATQVASHRQLAPGQLEIVTSGTHSYAHALAHSGLRDGPWQHRVSPGTIVFSDLRSHAAAADIGLRQAAYVATRVISVGHGRVTCDAGSKAITPDGTPPTCAVVDHTELRPARASEEHLPCELADGHAAPALGELLWLIPDHVCTSVNLHREAVWIRDGRFAGFGPIASGRQPRAPGGELK